MQFAIADLTTLVPAELDIIAMVKFIGLFAGSMLLLSLVGRMIFGHRSNLNHAVSSSMGIFFIYAATIVIYTFDSAGFRHFLVPLPYVRISDEKLFLFSFTEAETSAICAQILSMIILAFLTNLLDTLIPKGKRIISWFLLRIVTVVAAMLLHYLVTSLLSAFLPELLVTYAPTVLLGCLVVTLILGLLNGILSLVITVVNPILGAVYTFFFSNLVGKQVTKSILTTGILSAVVALLERYGYSVIEISPDTLGNYIPLLAVLLILWYLIGHKM